MKNISLIFLIFFSTSIFSQDLLLKGTVFEKDSDITLPGATIQVIGNDTGVVTDFDGNEILYGKKDLKNSSLILKSKNIL